MPKDSQVPRLRSHRPFCSAVESGAVRHGGHQLNGFFAVITIEPCHSPAYVYCPGVSVPDFLLLHLSNAQVSINPEQLLQCNFAEFSLSFINAT
jgi:hypothetical protein